MVNPNAAIKETDDDAAIILKLVARIRASMGTDAPSLPITTWMVEEWVELYRSSPSSSVKLSVLKMIAEAIMMLKPGVGLMARDKSNNNFVPKVTFNVKMSERLPAPAAPAIPVMLHEIKAPRVPKEASLDG